MTLLGILKHQVIDLVELVFRKRAFEMFLQWMEALVGVGGPDEQQEPSPCGWLWSKRESLAGPRIGTRLNEAEPKHTVSNCLMIHLLIHS